MDYRLMTTAAFMWSYDRDVLDLQDDPVSYINEVEAELEVKYLNAMGFDKEGNKVWPIHVMKLYRDIKGGPLWPEPKDHRSLKLSCLLSLFGGWIAATNSAALPCLSFCT